MKERKPEPSEVYRTTYQEIVKVLGCFDEGCLCEKLGEYREGKPVIFKRRSKRRMVYYGDLRTQLIPDEKGGSMGKKKIAFDPSKGGYETKPDKTPSSQCEVCSFWHHSRAMKCPQCSSPTKAARRAQEAGGQKAEAMISSAQQEAQQEAQDAQQVKADYWERKLDAAKRRKALLEAIIAFNGYEPAKRVLLPLMEAYGLGKDFEEDLKALG